MEAFDTKDVHKLEEHSTLLTKQMSRRSEWMKRYRNSSKCITSKAGLISLVWSFAAGTIYGMAYNPNNFIYIFPYSSFPVLLITFIGSAIILCFYPLAGFLADNKIGRYKTIIRSLQILFGCFFYKYHYMCAICTAFIFWKSICLNRSCSEFCLDISPHDSRFCWFQC